jgi:general secretion pathway protein D
MKTLLPVLILFLTAAGLRAQIPGIPGGPVDAPASATMPASVTAPPDANTPADANGGSNEVAGITYNWTSMDISQVLEVYSELVNRTLLHAGGLPAGQISLVTRTPLTKSEAKQALEAVLAMNGVIVVPIGTKFVKVVPSGDAAGTGQAVDNTDAANLPGLGSVITHIVQLHYVKPSEMQAALTPFAKLNSITPLDSNGILIIRDYAENLKLMLEMIDRVDVDVPAVYVSEVIPIKYALATDIASALNSLGGQGGGSTVSIGNSSGSTSGNGLRSIGSSTTGGIGGGGGYQNGAASQARPLGGAPGAAAGGAPGGASSFQQRLQSIIARASGTSGQDQIQVFGQAKIIADTRSNSLLIFATRADMDAITNVIAKLDVLLPQVLIESVIMEVSLGNGISTGVSAVQNPSAISSPAFKGAGGYNSGPSFLSFLSNNVVNVSSNGNTSFGNALQSGGFSYFGQLFGTDYDVAIQAAASDNSTTIIQKPRIQTFQAQQASFFVGQTVPYVTSTYNGGTTGIGSSFSQLSVGVELDVTPFINPDGLVVMQINEEIDDINGSTPIAGVGNVPNTDKRTLVSNVAVKDRDGIILGGAIRSEKDHNSSGVPFLQDIPILGTLFSAKTSNKTRDELLVLMRPTVLKTPELASLQAKVEEGRLPGIANAESQDNKEEAKQVAAEQKLEQLQDEKDARAAAKAQKSSKTNSIPAAVNSSPVSGTPRTTVTPPAASTTTSAPTTSVPKNVPAASAPKIIPPPAPASNPAAGLY